MNRLEVDQVMGPVRNHALFFCGFHVAKNNPEFQVTTMHYCAMRGEGDYEMHQCLLYDSIGAGAKLLGVEYIVPDKAFRSLPDEEKKYWHPHSYEVLGGGLVAPVMSDQAEIDFMTYLLTTWGKSWHTWPDPTTEVPLGEPRLMWSLTGDGQADSELIDERDRLFGVSTAETQAERVKAIGYEVPQVPQPRSVATIGRQWTASGEDRPTPRKVFRLSAGVGGCRSARARVPAGNGTPGRPLLRSASRVPYGTCGLAGVVACDGMEFDGSGYGMPTSRVPASAFSTASSTTVVSPSEVAGSIGTAGRAPR